MELFGTLVLILSAITTLRSRLVPNSFPKQVPWSNSIKTLLQSSTETSEWLPDRFQSRDRFHSRESLYIMRRVQSSQDLFVHQYDRCFIVLYTNMAGGGKERLGIFFHVETTASILYRPTLWWGYRPSSDLTVPYLLHSHSLCCHGTLLAIARRHKEQLTADSSNLSWERYLDNRLCRIGLGHLLEFIVSALGKMKVMQIGDVGKPGKRRKKNEM